MISTRSMGFDIGVRLGLRLGPLGYAECPVELGANPVQGKKGHLNQMPERP